MCYKIVMEQWKTIPMFPDYAVSDAGRVKRLTPASRTYVGKILKPMLVARYMYVGLVRPDGVVKRLRVHRLVAKAFILNPQNLPQVNHKNPHARHDNRVDNLEWVTPQSNSDHAVAHKLMEKPHFNAKHVYETAYNTWQAVVQHNYLGTFKTKIAALNAVDEYMGAL